MSLDDTGKPDDEVQDEPRVDDDQAPQDDESLAPDKPEDESAEEPDKPTPLRERFKDKSAEELLEIIEEQDKTLGKRGTDIGDLRARIDTLESSQQTVGREDEPTDDPFSFRPQTQPIAQPQVDPNARPPTEVPGMPKRAFDYEKPVESMIPVIQDVVGNMMHKQQMGQTYREFNINTAKAKVAFEVGAKSAFKGNKRLMSGIESEVKQRVYEFYNQYHMQGMPVDDTLRMEEPWIKAAQNIRLERGEFDKLQPEKTKPVSPTATDHPTSSFPSSRESEKRNVSVDFNDEEVRQMVKQYGLTRKQAEDIIAETQKAVESGDLKF